MQTISKEIRLASRTSGTPVLKNFQFAEVALPALGNGKVQVRNLWMSVDPYLPGRTRDYESYLPSFQIGRALEGSAVAEVVKSHTAEFEPGDLVLSMLGWRDIFDAEPQRLRKLTVPVASPEMYLGVCGNVGHTAYIGLTEVIRLKQGETIFISAAAGAVSSVACQIARLLGAKVIASADGAQKVEFLRSLGVEHVIDYKNAGARPGVCMTSLRTASMLISTMLVVNTWTRPLPPRATLPALPYAG